MRSRFQMYPPSLPWWDGFLSYGQVVVCIVGDGRNSLTIGWLFGDSHSWFLSYPQLFLYAGNIDALWFLLSRFSHILHLGSLGSNSRSSPLNRWFLMLSALYPQTINSSAGELQAVVPWHYFIWSGFYMLCLKNLGWHRALVI